QARLTVLGNAGVPWTGDADEYLRARPQPEQRLQQRVRDTAVGDRGFAHEPTIGRPGRFDAVVDGPLYDEIGGDYARHRRPDPAIAAMIVDALGTARSVVSVG